MRRLSVIILSSLACAFVACTPRLVAAGDISSPGSNRDNETATVVKSANPLYVLTLGDNQYEDGTLAQYTAPGNYNSTWGQFKAKTKPLPGNHEYHVPGAADYFDYFGSLAGERGKGYYAFNVMNWRIYALNTELSGSAKTTQLQWFKDDLAANPKLCTLLYMHRPRFTKGRYDDYSTGTTAELFAVFSDNSGDISLGGHDHNYQRYQLMNGAGLETPSGVRHFVVGTGGRGSYSLRADSRRIIGFTGFGALSLDLLPDSYSWRFLPVVGQTQTDSGSESCR